MGLSLQALLRRVIRTLDYDAIVDQEEADLALKAINMLNESNSRYKERVARVMGERCHLKL